MDRRGEDSTLLSLYASLSLTHTYIHTHTHTHTLARTLQAVRYKCGYSTSVAKPRAIVVGKITYKFSLFV